MFITILLSKYHFSSTHINSEYCVLQSGFLTLFFLESKVTHINCCSAHIALPPLTQVKVPSSLH